MKWPVLQALSSSALKSTTSRPNAAPLSVPASRPSTSASPEPLWPPIGISSPSALLRGIGDRLAVRGVHHPAFRHRLALQLVGLHRAVGDDRGGDVEHHRRLLARPAQRSRSDWCRAASRRRPRPACGWRWRPPNRCRSCRAAAPSRHRRRPRRHGSSAARRPRPRRSRFASAIAVSAARGITRWPMPLSPSTMAVAGAVFSTLMFGLRIDAAGLDAPHILRQPEHAMRVGAGEIGFEHQLGDLRRVGVRHADRRHRVPDQRRDGGRRNRARPALRHHFTPARSFCTRPLSIVTLSSSPHRQRLDLPRALERAHVVGIVAAEHDVRRAELLHQEFKLRLGVQDGVPVEACGSSRPAAS